MFERFDEAARRAIFLARLAAIVEESRSISLLHLLAGIKKECPGLYKKLALDKARVKLCPLSPANFEAASRAPREVPLEAKAKRALVAAAGIAEKYGSEKVTPTHLLAAILRADVKLQKQLKRAGLTEAEMKARIEKERKAGSEKLRTARSGIGYDLHRMAEGRKLVLGGVEIPFEKGPLGHSDGDVLSHAICDALLGAAGLGDIGAHFPDTDPKWRGVSSLVFLRQTRQYIERRHQRIRHIDAVVIAERPKLGPNFPAMRAILAKALGISPNEINLKAKTHEGLGELGRGEAIAAHAIATLEG